MSRHRVLFKPSTGTRHGPTSTSSKTSSTTSSSSDNNGGDTCCAASIDAPPSWRRISADQVNTSLSHRISAGPRAVALGFARSSGLARVFTGSPRSLVHLLTLGGIASALLEPVAAAASGPPEPPASMTKTSIVALVVALVLVIMGISFEKAQHYLIHHTGEHMQRVLISLFEELTLLGFIGLVLFIVEQLSAINDLSVVIFGDQNSRTLVSIVHNVHMVLFLVMVIFLVCVLLLIKYAASQTKHWHRAEMQCIDRKHLLEQYSAYLAKQRKRNPITRCLRHIFCTETARHNMHYNTMRARFIHPEDSDDDSNEAAMEAALEKQMAGDGTTVLDDSNAKLYRKKLMVYAFPTRDPCVFNKHWGDSSGSRDDMVIIGADNDLYVCPRKEFDSSYVLVEGEAHRYRKVGHVYARRMVNHFFVKQTKGGRQHGNAGSYLVQNTDGSQYSVSAVEFTDNYEPADGASHQAGKRKKRDLPDDFDFGEYLSYQLGVTLGQIVTVSVQSWCYVAACLVVMWAVLRTVLALSADEILATRMLHLAAFVGSVTVVVLVYTARRRLDYVESMLIPHQMLSATAIDQMQSRIIPESALAGMGVSYTSVRSDMSGSPQPSRIAAVKNMHSPVKMVIQEGKPSVASPLEAAGSHRSLQPLETGPPTPKGNGAAVVSLDVHRMITKTDTMGYTPTARHLEEDFDKQARTSRPKYLDTKLRTKRSRCWKCLGRPGNRHQALFWFDRHGTEFMLHFIRTILLLESVYVASSAVVLASSECDGNHPSTCVLSIVGMIVPPLIAASLLPGLIIKFVLVSNIEMLKKVKVVNEILRRQRTKKSLRALKLLAVMRSHANKMRRQLSFHRKGWQSGDDKEMPSEPPNAGAGAGAGAGAYNLATQPSASAVTSPASIRDDDVPSFRGAAARVYGKPGTAKYLRRRKELHEAFALFDRQNTGTVSVTNIVSMLDLVGFADTAREAAEMIVNEVDGDHSGSIEFEEFFDWIASMDEAHEVSPHALVESIFKMIDRDRSNDITVAELRDTLTSLGAVMTAEDVLAIVREADHDGDGNINRHEFEMMMSKHLVDLYH